MAAPSKRTITCRQPGTPASCRRAQMGSKCASPGRLSPTVSGGHEEAAEAEFQAAVEFLRGFVHVEPVHCGNGYHAIGDGTEEVGLPGVVGTAVGVREFHVLGGEGEDADGREQHAPVHAPVVEQRRPGVGLVAGRRAAIDVLEAAGEELHPVDVGPTEPGQHAFEHDLLADDELLDAIVFLDADRPVPVLRFEVAHPQVGGFHHVGVAVDHGHGLGVQASHCARGV